MSRKPTPLPEGVQAVRISSGTALASLEEGAPLGYVLLPPGWYFTEAGHARLWAAVDTWQSSIKALQVRLDAMQPRVTNLHCPPPPPPPPHPHCGVEALGAFVLGAVFGRFLLRRPQRVA